MCCPLCEGRGRFDDIECPQCDRTGWVSDSIFGDAPRVRSVASQPRPVAAVTASARPAFAERVEADLEVRAAPRPDERFVVLLGVFVAGVAAHPFVVALFERVVHA